MSSLQPEGEIEIKEKKGKKIPASSFFEKEKKKKCFQKLFHSRAPFSFASYFFLTSLLTSRISPWTSFIRSFISFSRAFIFAYFSFQMHRFVESGPIMPFMMRFKDLLFKRISPKCLAVRMQRNLRKTDFDT